MRSFFFAYISNSHSHFYIKGHLLLLLSPHNPFTFKRLFTFKLRRDVAVATSRRVWRYVVTQFRAHRQGGKKHQNAGCNPERLTFRFVKYLSIVYGIVNFLPVCASTV